jgi:hypothetical protein
VIPVCHSGKTFDSSEDSLSRGRFAARGLLVRLRAIRFYGFVVIVIVVVVVVVGARGAASRTTRGQGPQREFQRGSERPFALQVA